MTNDESEPAFNARLARMIRDYWKARGHDVTVLCRHRGFSNAMREVHVVLESDMQDGLPRPQADRSL